MNDRKRALSIWQSFAKRPGATVSGNVGIASAHAIGGLLRVLQKRRPRRVLELGAGIGTLTFTVLDTLSRMGVTDQPDFRFDTVETQPFCLGQLDENLEGFEGKYRVHSDLSEVREAGIAYDLVIVDGGGDLPNDLGVLDFSGLLERRGVILVEGGRAFQRRLIADWYGHRRHVYTKSSAFRAELEVPGQQLRARNKAYHLYLFEPTIRERLTPASTTLLHDLPARVLRRLGARGAPVAVDDRSARQGPAGGRQ